MVAVNVASQNAFLKAIRQLSEKHHLTRLDLYHDDEGNPTQVDVPWFPRHISELDRCHLCLVKYEPTTDPRHPGYGDDEYIRRRNELNDIAKSYRQHDVYHVFFSGEPLPEIEYTEQEHKTWEEAYKKLKSLHPSHTCVEYQQNFQQMEREGLLEPTRIPRISKISKYLQRKTGFSLRPCTGLLSARDFLASLAFRTFQTTMYIRHHASPHHSPEPDLVHEFIGHCPMFADPGIADFSQQIGLLSLGATDQQIEQLATNGTYKAIGAGLLSSFGELQHACSDKPQHEAFDPERTALQKYEDADYQQLYFVADSIVDAMKKLRQFARNFNRPFSTVYNPYNQTIEIIRDVTDLLNGLDRFKSEITSLINAFESIHVNRSNN